MAALNRQARSNLEGTPAINAEHEFTIRPELTPSAELSLGSFTDHKACALIAEFRKFQAADNDRSKQEISLLLDHIDNQTVRNYLIDGLRISDKPHFGFSEVRADIFKALTPYVDDPLVRLVCAHEFKRKINDSISCQAASEALSQVKSLDSSPEVKQFCLTLIQENIKLFSAPSVPPGLIAALRAVGKDPELTRINNEVSETIKAYRAGNGNVDRLDLLAAIGTDKTWSALAKIANERLAPKWSLNPDDYDYLTGCGDDPGWSVVVYILGSVLIGGMSSVLGGSAIADKLNSTALGIAGGVGMFITGVLLPTLIPATFNAIFKRKDVNPHMREHALLLIAKYNPDLEDGGILLKALSDPKRADSLTDSIIAGLTKARSAATIKNIVNFLKDGPPKARLKLLKGLADSENPEIRAAIVGCKKDVVMEIGDEATKIAASWQNY